ncbi:MAG TPA: NUDIX domain-containing protein [Abditibacteriaceae bacterium]|jgi:8-oxo-dGTP diphosphatase|nr:NUDIX domain-containing protein [Abditibacteriaceae bacterium]
MKNTNASEEEYAKPSVTVDVLVFTILEDRLKVALVKRGVEPFKGRWALPGGFVHIDESLDEAARRELEEEAGICDVFLEQLYTFGNVARDPRTRVITVAYYALVPGQRINLVASTDAADAQWFSVDELPVLAFDHTEIMKTGLERLKSKLEYSNIAYGLLPARFRLSDLQKVYEIISGRAIDKRNFRKKMLSLNIVEATKYVDASGAHRPAQLYRFKKRKTVFFS